MNSKSRADIIIFLRMAYIGIIKTERRGEPIKMGGVSIYYIESREGYKYFWYSNTIWCLVVLQYGGHDSWQGQGCH